MCGLAGLVIPHNSVAQTSSPPWPGTFTGVGTRQQHHQHNIALDKFWTTVLDLWLSSGSVKKPCISMSPINHLYYGSAEYQKTHQIASYMWPGNMPGGDVISAEGRCDEGGMVLAASDGRCWHLIWNGSCSLTINLGLSLVTHPETGLWLARNIPAMRAEKQWHWPWPGHHGWWGTQSEGSSRVTPFITTTTQQHMCEPAGK